MEFEKLFDKLENLAKQYFEQQGNLSRNFSKILDEKRDIFGLAM